MGGKSMVLDVNSVNDRDTNIYFANVNFPEDESGDHQGNEWENASEISDNEIEEAYFDNGTENEWYTFVPQKNGVYI